MTFSTRLHLLRHGEVDPSWQGRFYGNLDVQLSAQGQRQSQRAAERMQHLPLAAVVSSGLLRAEHTAVLLRASRGLERRDEPQLQEIHRGAWRGLTLAELEARDEGALARWNARPASTRPEGGESLADAHQRVLPVVLGLVQQFPEQEIAIVAHLWVLRSLLCSALGLELDQAPRIELPTGSWTVLDWPTQEGQAKPMLVGLDLEDLPPRAERWSRGAHHS